MKKPIHFPHPVQDAESAAQYCSQHYPAIKVVNGCLVAPIQWHWLVVQWLCQKIVQESQREVPKVI